MLDNSLGGQAFELLSFPVGSWGNEARKRILGKARGHLADVPSTLEQGLSHEDDCMIPMARH